MHNLNLRSHHSTTNLYVKLEILKTNVVELTTYTLSEEFDKTNFFHKEEAKKILKEQINFLEDIKKKVAAMEQLQFVFGLPIK